MAMNHLTGGGKLQTNTFQGVRVRNSVKEILMQIRNTKCLSSGYSHQEKEEDLNVEQYIELKAIIGNKKRPYEYLSDEPAIKRPANYQIPLVLTPPDTPNAIDMEDQSTNENSKDSSCESLQNIINIKHGSSPVSLNTVQVKWMNTVVHNDKPLEEPYQDGQVQQIQQCLGFQTIVPQSVDQSASAFAYLPAQDSHVPFTSLSDCSQFSAKKQMPTYEQTFDSSGLCDLDWLDRDLDWLDQNLSSLLNEMDDSSCDLNRPVPLHTKNSDSSQCFSPVCNANFSPPVLLNSCSISPLHSSVTNQASPLQLNKSFFQWQLDQEERKLGPITQEQLLAKDSDGDTFLHIAVAHGRRALSYVLARKMAAINRIDIKEHNNQSALQIAVVANQHLIVQDLVGLGAEVNTTDCWGRTPLHVCAEKGYSQILQAIQKCVLGSNLYVDTEATNYEGLTALHCAVMSHNAAVNQLPKTQQPQTPPIHELLLKTKSLIDTIRSLINMGASIDARDRKSGRSVLHLAAEGANLELLRLFLDLPNSLSYVNAKAYNGNTALHIVASLTHLDAVRLLMRKGADPSARNLENEQPVHLVSDGPVGEQVRRVLKGKSVQSKALLLF